MTEVRRNFKDSLFRMVFQGKEELLSLYNAVNDSHYTNADDLEINTLEDVVYMGVKNDVSFLLCNYLNLYEAQSTYNPNMPLRGFLYFGEVIKGLIEINHLDVYSGKLLRLPMPKFLVFYNGLREEPERKTLRLSDSFLGKEKEEPALECIAVMLNINYGYNKKLMERCRALHDYSYFIEKVRMGVRAGKTLEEAVDDAINYSLREGILKDILRKNRAEVKRVVLTEYNEELHLDNVRKEGYEQGLEQGLEQGIEQGLAMGYDRGKIMQLIHIIAKKVKKKKSLELISEAMEEDPENLRPIYDAVTASGPDYDEDKAYQILVKNICSEHD